MLRFDAAPGEVVVGDGSAFARLTPAGLESPAVASQTLASDTASAADLRANRVACDQMLVSRIRFPTPVPTGSVLSCDALGNVGFTALNPEQPTVDTYAISLGFAGYTSVGRIVKYGNLVRVSLFAQAEVGAGIVWTPPNTTLLSITHLPLSVRPLWTQINCLIFRGQNEAGAVEFFRANVTRDNIILQGTLFNGRYRTMELRGFYRMDGFSWV